MKCTKISKKFSAYLDGEVQGSVLELVEKHLASCEKCRTELEQLKRVDSLLGSIPGAEKAPFLLTRVRAELRKPVSEHWWEKVFHFSEKVLLPATVAAGLFVGFLLGSQLYTRFDNDSTNYKSLADYNSVITKISETSLVQQYSELVFEVSEK